MWRIRWSICCGPWRWSADGVIVAERGHEWRKHSRRWHHAFGRGVSRFLFMPSTSSEPIWCVYFPGGDVKTFLGVSGIVPRIRLHYHATFPDEERHYGGFGWVADFARKTNAAGKENVGHRDTMHQTSSCV